MMPAKKQFWCGNERRLQSWQEERAAEPSHCKSGAFSKPKSTKGLPHGRPFVLCLPAVTGSSTWARTRDLRINSPALYQLSYRGTTRPGLYTQKKSVFAKSLPGCTLSAWVTMQALYRFKARGCQVIGVRAAAITTPIQPPYSLLPRQQPTSVRWWQTEPLRTVPSGGWHSTWRGAPRNRHVPSCAAWRQTAGDTTAMRASAVNCVLLPRQP